MSEEEQLRFDKYELERDMREEAFLDYEHDRRMENDSEYFINIVIENLHIDGATPELEIPDIIHEYIKDYSNFVTVEDILKALKET